ncbi:putative secreted protein [Caulobacter ginsengisoli]|uniref:Secreted protein n=1 Tax=Caulobacter ginsengisoli TaxID=400775 RepID=A0ABU0INL9_9CAUL|nr:DUF1467 family protein [Caulobacter ginsengisoli]MDQ0463006.1 putative secreted protein [Caulobacter ginsengisoli]
MGPVTGIAIYLTIWWTALFCILPLGARSHHEMGIDLKDGGDPGAPVNPNLKRKFFTTTWVSAIIFALFWLTIQFHWVTLPQLPANY